MTKIYYLHQGDNIPFYVGKTNLSLNQRLGSHKKKFNNIFIELIEEVNIQDWKIWECFWIEQFKQWGFKLENKNKGGGGSTKWTLEQKENKHRREKLSKALKGKLLGVKGYWKNKTHTLKTKNKMSMAHKGTPLSIEHKHAISKAMEGHSKTDKWKKNLSKSSSKSFGRPVLQKDLNGNVVKEWETGKLASQILNLSYTAINNCCRNNEKNIIRQRDKNKLGKYTSFNYIWEYKK